MICGVLNNMFRVLQPSVQEPVEFKNTVKKYGYYLDESKKRVFGVIGTVDFVEFINSHLPQCDYSQIMASLMPSSVEFEDFDGVLALEEKINDPNDGLYYMSLLQDEFQKLPLEVKENYGKDFSIFARDFISGGFANFVAEKYGSNKSSENDTNLANGIDASDGSESGIDGKLGELARQLGELQRQATENQRTATEIQHSTVGTEQSRDK